MAALCSVVLVSPATLWRCCLVVKKDKEFPVCGGQGMCPWVRQHHKTSQPSSINSSVHAGALTPRCWEGMAANECTNVYREAWQENECTNISGEAWQ